MPKAPDIDLLQTAPLQTDALQTDISIVGDGLTAFASAAVLAQANPDWRIALVKPASSLVSTKPSASIKDLDSQADEPKLEDVRTIALSGSSLEIFSSMGIYHDIATNAAAIDTIQVSDRGHSGLSRLDKDENSETGATVPLGLVIENQHLSGLLETLLSRQHNITRIDDMVVQTLQPKANGFCLQGKNLAVSTHLLLIADGSSSPLRDQLGIQQTRYDYQQTALVATLTLTEAHRGIAYERFTANGPMALLPMTDAGTEDKPEHRASLVWTLPTDRAQALQEQITQNPTSQNSELLDLFHSEFGQRAGTIKAIGKPAFVPLQRKLAAEQIRSHVALIGSAAQTLHPVAGQGFNLALRDIAALAETLLAASRQGRKPGELADLQRYLKTRERDQQRTIQLSHYLPKIFSSNSSPLILGRNLGLTGLNLSPLLRRSFARNAAGLGFRQSRFDHRYGSRQNGNRQTQHSSLPQDRTGNSV